MRLFENSWYVVIDFFLLLLHIGYWFNCGLNLHLIFLYSHILTENSSFSEDILNSSNFSDTLFLELSTGIIAAGRSICTTFMIGLLLYILLSTLSTYFLASKDSHFGNRKHWCLSHNDFWNHLWRKIFHSTFWIHFWIKWVLQSVLSGNLLNRVNTLHRIYKLEL